MAPNHGGDTIESMLGPVGSHWVQKMGQNRKKLPCPKSRIFDYPAVIGFSQKMELTVMAPNHGREPLGAILGPKGPHWVQKMCQNRKKLTCPKIRIFDYPAVIGFSQKMEVTVMAPYHGGGPLGSIVGPMGSHWVQKMGQNVKNYHARKFEFSITPDIDFSHQMEVTVMAPNHGGDPLGSILGPVGSHWVKKRGKNRKKLPCLKIGIFEYPEVIDFSQKMEFTVVVPNHGGDPLGSILGPMGSHWIKKYVKTVKNYHAPKFEFSITPRSSFSANNGSYGYGAKSRWGPPRVHLGANGVPLDKKICQNRKKLPCPKIRNFDYPAVIVFSHKMEFTVIVPNHSEDALGSILGPMGSHWVQKMCQNRKKLPCPKIRIFDPLGSSVFRIKWNLRLWCQITVGTP